MTKNSRRKFLSLFSKGLIATAIVPPILSSCGNYPNKITAEKMTKERLDFLRSISFNPIESSDLDDLLLAEGMEYKTLISWDEKISDQDRFGYNNDFLCYIPLDDDQPNEGLLWANHEYVNSLFINNLSKGEKKDLSHVDKELYNVGGSIVHIKKTGDEWKVIHNSQYNRRITGKTSIPFNWDEKIGDSHHAIGTNSNCSGGLTPWGTFLSCEENFQDYFGDLQFENNKVINRTEGRYQWQNYYPYPSEHYGWVVEIDPKTGSAQKHVALGRFSHECCTLIEQEDGTVVAYTGDDKKDEFIYKFVGSKPGSLKEGVLYVADTENGQWLSLDYNSNTKLRDKFLNQTEVLIRAREAARVVGATPQNRPEDIEIDPISGHVFISLTNNSNVDDVHGSILRINELGDYRSTIFKAETYIMGGPESGLTCPDNLAFDLAGNLWVTSDISTSKMNKKSGPYYPNFKNNALFVIPRYGALAGRAIQVASAPRDAELTGPWFSPDYKTLFLSVQHPGEKSKKGKLTSHWPANDGKSIPRPTVVTIEGPLLDKLNYMNHMVISE